MFRSANLLLALLLPSLASASNTLTIMAPAAPGGGWDQTARVMQRVLMEIEPGAVVQVDNVPGAAGTIGLARFVQSERGNPNALMITGLVMVSGVITNQSPVSLADASPIARLTGEFEIIAVPASSPYQSMRGLVDAFRKDPGAIAWGGGSAGGTDDLLVRLLAEQVGLPASRVNYIAFAGGGAALAAVLGGQVTAGVSGYAEFAGQIEAGQLRVLAVSAPARVTGIDAPTLRESGIALDLANWRGIVAPPGLSDAERAALVDRMSRLARSDAWVMALRQNGWEDLFLAGPEFRQFVLAEQARVSAVLARLTATNADVPATPALRVTPMTIPTAIALLFSGALLLFAARRPGIGDRGSGIGPAGILCTALLVQPFIYPALGFVVASTMVFTVASGTMRGMRPRPSATARDLAIGAALAVLLYTAFTRGLGVQLP